MPIDVARAPTTASPLWIIALFIALSEATAGVAAVETDGASRLVFACFAVTFPVAVFVTFVWLLVKHAPNLYAPGQYSKDITPEMYRTGIFAPGIGREDRTVIAKAFAQTIVPLLEDDKGPGPDRQAIETRVAETFEQAVVDATVSVSISALRPGSSELQLAVSDDTTVDSFLDTIWFSLPHAIQPYTYGNSWVLINDAGEELPDMGTKWAAARGLDADARPLTEVGIRAGTRLVAIPRS